MTVSCLKEWWQALLWIIKNPRLVLKAIEDPRFKCNVPSNPFSVVILIVAFIGLIPILAITSNLSSPSRFLALPYVLIFVLFVLVERKLDTDRFNQHYEIREKQREVDR